MSPRKQIERTLVDNIFQNIEIIVSKIQTALAQKLWLCFEIILADTIRVDKYVILHLSTV